MLETLPLRALRAECELMRARLAECQTRLAECEAREALESGTPLTIAQVATLAGMAPRSVRNAALATAADRLPTVSVRGQTLVPAADARAWLARRRKALPL